MARLRDYGSRRSLLTTCSVSSSFHVTLGWVAWPTLAAQLILLRNQSHRDIWSAWWRCSVRRALDTCRGHFYWDCRRDGRACARPLFSRACCRPLLRLRCRSSPCFRDYRVIAPSIAGFLMPRRRAATFLVSERRLHHDREAFFRSSRAPRSPPHVSLLTTSRRASLHLSNDLFAMQLPRPCHATLIMALSTSSVCQGGAGCRFARPRILASAAVWAPGRFFSYAFVQSRLRGESDRAH